MANTHVVSKAGKYVDVVIHVPIPATANSAGTQWRTTAVQNGYGSTALPDGDGTGGTISAAEKAEIVSGAVIELQTRFKLGANPGVADLDAGYAAEKTKFLSEFQAKYNRYGMTR